MARANIIKDVRKMKEKLIKKAKKSGIYENFGQEEHQQLKKKWQKYIDAYPNSAPLIQKELDDFLNWCENFDMEQLRG